MNLRHFIQLHYARNRGLALQRPPVQGLPSEISHTCCDPAHHFLTYAFI